MKTIHPMKGTGTWPHLCVSCTREMIHRKKRNQNIKSLNEYWGATELRHITVVGVLGSLWMLHWGFCRW